ncbi:hypothetical protein B8W90_12840, partial [Staphylococcus hominis]
KDPETQRALHALGDSFAHVKENGEHFGPEKGHLMASLFGKEPDNPYTNKEAFINYVSALYKAASSTPSQPRRDAEYADEIA